MQQMIAPNLLRFVASKDGWLATPTDFKRLPEILRACETLQVLSSGVCVCVCVCVTNSVSVLRCLTIFPFSHCYDPVPSTVTRSASHEHTHGRAEA